MFDLLLFIESQSSERLASSNKRELIILNSGDQNGWAFMKKQGRFDKLLSVLQINIDMIIFIFLSSIFLRRLTIIFDLLVVDVYLEEKVEIEPILLHRKKMR